jgi:putative transposase
MKLVRREGAGLSVSRQCGLLGVCRASLYYKPQGEGAENLRLMRLIDGIWLQHPYYGTAKMTEVLRWDHNEPVNHKRVERLYGVMGLRSIAPGPHTSRPGDLKHVHPYLLKGLAIDRPNQVWAVDITYIPMERGYLYLVAFIDLHSRAVVGWGISNSMEAAWVIEVLEEAIRRHGKPEIVNSGQGSQFTSEAWVACLGSHGIRISMDGKGRAKDNIFIERLWRTVKYEHVYPNPAGDGLELYTGLKGFFHWYNTQRRHEGIGYQRPVDLYPHIAHLSTKEKEAKRKDYIITTTFRSIPV